MSLKHIKRIRRCVVSKGPWICVFVGVFLVVCHLATNKYHLLTRAVGEGAVGRRSASGQRGLGIKTSTTADDSPVTDSSVNRRTGPVTVQASLRSTATRPVHQEENTRRGGDILCSSFFYLTSVPLTVCLFHCLTSS